MNIVRIIAAFLIVLTSIGVLDAQGDLAKVLVGKWEGQLDVSGLTGVGFPPERTLIIESVRGESGEWVVEGKYGVTGRRLFPVNVGVETVGSEIILRFVTAENARVKLTLLKEKYLDGQVERSDFRRPIPIRLEKGK